MEFLLDFFLLDFFDFFRACSVTGVVSSVIALPFDNVKMKLMKMTPDGNGKMPYKGVMDCFLKTFKREGALGPWVGFFGFWSLVAPHTMITLMVMDYLHDFFGSDIMKKL